MIRSFLRDKRGNYALLTAVALIPIMGGLALAVDYSEMARQRQETLNALDAAGIATARRIVEGATDDQAKSYAKSFFEANLGSVEPSQTQLTVVLPQNNTGGGTLKLIASLTYEPYFLPTFTSLIRQGGVETTVDFSATSEVRLKNTLEVALVLDNSGSMNEIGTGSSKVRFDLLKSAAKELVDTLSQQAGLMKQIDKPVRFGLVPFAASVNVGSDKKTASWMDQDGISPIHHENFDWSTFTASDKKVTMTGGVYYKQGTGWGSQANQKVTRFTLYDDLKRITGYHQEQTGTKQTCTGSGSKKKCKDEPVYTDVPDYGSYASWAGCVEARPNPYNIDDTTPSTATPATLFVPMFAPDETDRKNYNGSERNYWPDSSSGTDLERQRYMPKYYAPAPQGTSAATGDKGPNGSCTTKAITALTDVSTTAGKTAIKGAIDAMVANGATNVPEGMAWGWRLVSSSAPFTEGRSESEKGNDKVVIVLTDGANTYYTPESLGYEDLAANKSIYSNYGYAGRWPSAYSTSRLFQGAPASVSKTDYSNANYTKAMNAQFDSLCQKAKAANIIVMTVALDLNSSNNTEKAQIDALKACASDSKSRKNPTTGKPEKLFWNATGKSLSDDFKAIGNELSNLRIVS